MDPTEDRLKEAFNLLELMMHRLEVERDGWQKLSDAYAIEGATILANKCGGRARALFAAMTEMRDEIERLKG
jgi:hypothetical protein